MHNSSLDPVFEAERLTRGGLVRPTPNSKWQVTAGRYGHRDGHSGELGRPVTVATRGQDDDPV